MAKKVTVEGEYRQRLNSAGVTGRSFFSTEMVLPDDFNKGDIKRRIHEHLARERNKDGSEKWQGFIKCRTFDIAAVEDISEEEAGDVGNAGPKTLAELNMAALKKMCKDLELSTSGVKADLIDRLENYDETAAKEAKTAAPAPGVVNDSTEYGDDGLPPLV